MFRRKPYNRYNTQTLQVFEAKEENRKVGRPPAHLVFLSISCWQLFVLLAIEHLFINYFKWFNEEV